MFSSRKILLGAAVVVAGALLFAIREYTCNVDPYEAYFRKANSLARQTKKFNGLEAFWTFDDLYFENPKTSQCTSGVIASPGKFGTGGKFDGHDDTFIQTHHCWENTDGNLTVSLWVKIKPDIQNQDIFCTWAQELIGFRLDRGNMTFDYPTLDGHTSVSYKFKSYNRFIHLAAVGNIKDGKLTIYENGVQKCEVPISGFKAFSWQILIGRGNLKMKRNPCKGIIDEISIWNRPFSEHEIKSLAGSSVSIGYSMPLLGRRIELILARVQAQFLSKIGGVLNSFSFDAVRYIRANRNTEKMPYISLYIDNSYCRDLSKAHSRSKASGHKTRSAAKTVDAFISDNGKISKCRVSLSGGTLSYSSRERAAYIIEPADVNDLILGKYRKIEIAPPETSGYLIRIAESMLWGCFKGKSILNTESTAVRFRINGLDKGVFIVSDSTRQMISDGEMINPLLYENYLQPMVQKIAESMHENPEILPLRTELLAKTYLTGTEKKAIENRLLSVAESFEFDRNSPIPLRKRSRILREMRKKIQEQIYGPVDIADFLIDEQLVLGENLSPWKIEKAIDTAIVTTNLPAGWSVNFKSESPDWIDDNGKIIAVPQDIPARVQMSATVSSPDNRSVTRKLKFRLMPKQQTLPSVFIWTGIPLGRSHRTDAALEIYFSDSPIPSFFSLTALRDNSGIRYKGNSSFARSKKLINIKTDVPHKLFGNSLTRSLIGINALTDQLQVWNSFAYSTFRQFPLENNRVNISPSVIHVELYLNGCYYGLVEFAERIDKNLLDEKDCVVFRHTTAKPRTSLVKQTEPSVRDGYFMDVYNVFEDSLRGEQNEQLYALIQTKLDVLNAIDYQILYSVMANDNGYPFDFLVHDALVFNPADQKMKYVPWDFDDGGSTRRHFTVVRNQLDIIMENSSPDHRKHVAERWRDLRKNVLSTENLLADFDRILSGHFNYLEFESERWCEKPVTREEFFRLKQDKRNAIIQKLKQLDEAFQVCETK